MIVSCSCISSTLRSSSDVLSIISSTLSRGTNLDSVCANNFQIIVYKKSFVWIGTFAYTKWRKISNSVLFIAVKVSVKIKIPLIPFKYCTKNDRHYFLSIILTLLTLNSARWSFVTRLLASFGEDFAESLGKGKQIVIKKSRMKNSIATGTRTSFQIVPLIRIRQASNYQEEQITSLLYQ